MVGTEQSMEIREAMSTEVLTVNPERTLKEVAELMDERNYGAAVVVDPEQPGPGIFTERDLLHAVAAGLSLASEQVSEHVTTGGTFAEPGWSLEEAAKTMVRGGF